MDLQDHFKEALRITPVASPWPRMAVCAFATVLPLLVGIYFNQLLFAIFGALAGFLIVLNDHQGTLGHRLWVLTLTFVILVGGLLLGFNLAFSPVAFVAVLGIWVYWLGLLAGAGAEIERAFLFGAFQLLAGAYAGTFGSSVFKILPYFFLGYFTVLVLLVATVLWRGHSPVAYARVRASLKTGLTWEAGRHRYAFAYLVTVLMSLAVVKYFSMNHGYWAVGTALLILRRDSKESFYRIIQRLFGTVIGVLLAEVFVYSVHSLAAAVAILFFVSFWGPWALMRNYWLGTAVISLMLLIILDLPTLQAGNYLIPIVRLQATGVGCLTSLVGILIVQPGLFFKRNHLTTPRS